MLSPVFLLSAALAWAGEPPAPAPLRRSIELKVPLCPVAIELETATHRIKWVRLAFVPYAWRGRCQKKTVKECRDLMAELRLPSYAKHRKEPQRIFEITVGESESDLLARLSTVPAVAELRDRKDAAWEAAGKGVEYPFDKSRAFTAKVRWLMYVNREELELEEALR